MTTVTFDHVVKQFRQKQGESTQLVTAVDGVSIKIPEGDVLAVLGPSGCGKTTFLRLIAGLEMPDSGQILYDNVDLKDIPTRERGIGMVFQEGALMPHWEGWRTVGFFLSLRKREQEVPERVRRVAEITGIGLERLLDRKPSQLSGGERQRVGIARALARDPRVFLFDEPFSSLDAKIRAQARVELKRLLYEFPVTSIYVTHDQVEAVALAHHIAVMRAGKIEQIGTYHQLYNSPINLFVAGFIGTPLINEFPGRVDDGHWQGNNFSGYPIRHDLPAGAPVTMGIRPEFVHPAAEGVAGIVDQVTPFFADRFQLVNVHQNKEHWSFKVSMDEQIPVGSIVRCTLDPEGLLFFDTKTGKRIG
jgi:multiple sugar transport system ATP-binding protein